MANNNSKEDLRTDLGGGDHNEFLKKHNLHSQERKTKIYLEKMDKDISEVKNDMRLIKTNCEHAEAFMPKRRENFESLMVLCRDHIKDLDLETHKWLRRHETYKMRNNKLESRLKYSQYVIDKSKAMQAIETGWD